MGAEAAPKPTKAQTCEAFKNTAAGAKALCRSLEHAKQALGKPHSFAKCESLFMSAFAKIEQQAGGQCPTEGDAATIEALIDTCVGDVAAALSGSPPTPPPPCQKFPASGQTTAFQADKNDGITGPVAVPDDGTVEAGATLNYTDNNDGTITDNNTGLQWEKKSDDNGLHDKDNSYAWSGLGVEETIWDWLEDVNAENGTGFAGFNDWRVPNVKELQSIVNYEFRDPAVSDAFKTPCASGSTVTDGSCTASEYWSSTADIDSADFAWIVVFVNGGVGSGFKGRFLSVRAVRGGSP